MRAETKVHYERDITMTTPADIFNTCGSAIPDAVKSQMFGKPCFKIGGKAFVCLFQDCMVFKLTGKSHETAIGLNAALLFDPSGKGRPMKQWVQLPAEHAHQWPAYAQAALTCVRAAT